MSALGDCTCPVCLGILVEPVVMPCKHELCRECFSNYVEQASLSCPLCRRRIASWARLSAKAGTLVDKKRWAQIKKRFKRELQEKDASASSTAAPEPPSMQLAQPGEIYREYLAELSKLRAEQDEQRRQEDAASEALARQLQAEEEGLEGAELGGQSSRLSRAAAAAAAASAAEEPPQPAHAGFVRLAHAEVLPGGGGNVVAVTGAAAPLPPDALSLSYPERRPGDFCRLAATVTHAAAAAACSGSTEAWAAPGNVQSKFSALPATDQQLGAMHPFCDLSNTVGRSTSVDSLGAELNVFKPIRAYPLTPPRDGKKSTGAAAALVAPKAARRLLQHGGGCGTAAAAAAQGAAAATAELVASAVAPSRSRLDSAAPGSDDAGGSRCVGGGTKDAVASTTKLQIIGRGKRPLRCSSSSSSSSSAAAAADVRPPSLVDERALPAWPFGGRSDGGPTPACPSSLSCHLDDGDDGELAKLLQSMYDMELKYKLNGVRMRGSGLEYALRPRGSSVQPHRQPDASPPVLEASIADEPPPPKLARRGRLRR